MSDYFSDREQRPRAQIVTEIESKVWKGIHAIIWARINDGSFGYKFHADSPRSIDLQTYINLCDSILVLFYQLIFLVIGYTGYYTDYSTYHYPNKKFDKNLSIPQEPI